MAQPADPQSVLEAIKETHAERRNRSAAAQMAPRPLARQLYRKVIRCPSVLCRLIDEFEELAQ
jgi:hypothetical protein